MEQVVGSDLSVCVSVLWSRSSGGRLAQEWAASPRSAPGDPPLTHQRDVIVHRDNTGYGFTVSGDTPVSVLSVKLGESETTACSAVFLYCFRVTRPHAGSPRTGLGEPSVPSTRTSYPVFSP